MCRDLSYWGFQQLAHPLNGIMMTEFRPVSCDTHQPLSFDPGFINSTIYGDKVETGWAWFPYKQNTDNFWLPVCMPCRNPTLWSVSGMGQSLVGASPSVSRNARQPDMRAGRDRRGQAPCCKIDAKAMGTFLPILGSEKSRTKSTGH